MKLRHGLFALDPKAKRKHKNLTEDESDIDDEWVAKYEDESREKEIEKAQKKWEKDNEKLEADGKEAHDEDVLDARITKINEEYDRLKEERGTEKAELKKLLQKVASCACVVSSMAPKNPATSSDSGGRVTDLPVVEKRKLPRLA